MSQLPTQFTDETASGFTPLRVADRASVRRAGLAALKRELRAERERRIPAWIAHYERGGAGWIQALAEARAVFERRATVSALFQAADHVGWDPVVLRDELVACGVTVPRLPPREEWET